MVKNLTNLLSSVVRRDRAEEQVVAVRDTCLVCEADLAGSELYAQHRTCPVCRFHYSMTARERIDSLVDPRSFRERNRSLTSLDPLSFSSRTSYRQRIFQDQRRTGLTEAVVTGTCTIGGSPAMLIVLDFGFMGGTMGCVVGEKVALALEQAAKRTLPAIAVVTSGGARIQEGVLSLMQMAKTSVAHGKLGEKGLPMISVLANPATGQTFASFANLADIILAEPGAILGLSPIRLIEESSTEPLPRGSHTAESHQQNGMIDAVVDRTELRELLGILLDLLGPGFRLKPMQKDRRPQIEAPRPEAWSSVQLARHQSRPSSSDYIGRIFGSFVELHGDRFYGDDDTIVVGLGKLGGQTVMIVAQERGSRSSGRTSPEGFRKAQRAFKLASKFELPLITFIDTPGADLSLDAEQRGLGYTIASAMAEMAGIQVPSISVVIGEGGSAGALALGVADRVLMMEHAIYSAISPEDAAGLIFQDETRADEAAESLRLTATDCLDLGIIDMVVPEPPGGAHTNPEAAARQLLRVLLQLLADMQSGSKRRMLSGRYRKFRKMGEYNSHFRAAITREVTALRGLVATGVRRIARRGADEPEEWLEGLPAEEDEPVRDGAGRTKER